MDYGLRGEELFFIIVDVLSCLLCVLYILMLLIMARCPICVALNLQCNKTFHPVSRF